jgi:hypothetical protein
VAAQSPVAGGHGTRMILMFPSGKAPP